MTFLNMKPTKDDFKHAQFYRDNYLGKTVRCYSEMFGQCPRIGIVEEIPEPILAGCHSIGVKLEGSVEVFYFKPIQVQILGGQSETRQA